jgi:hypothetical protein
MTTMTAPTERERRIATLQSAIRWNEAFLRTIPRGADPKGEESLAQDKDELESLLAETEAA